MLVVCFDMTINPDAHMLPLTERQCCDSLGTTLTAGEQRGEPPPFVGLLHLQSTARIEAGKHRCRQCPKWPSLCAWRLLQTCCHQVAILSLLVCVCVVCFAMTLSFIHCLSESLPLNLPLNVECLLHAVFRERK